MHRRFDAPTKECACGSGLQRYALHDARGFFCCYACLQCEPAARRHYRPDIFTDADYECDEPIDED